MMRRLRHTEQFDRLLGSRTAYSQCAALGADVSYDVTSVRCITDTCIWSTTIATTYNLCSLVHPRKQRSEADFYGTPLTPSAGITRRVSALLVILAVCLFGVSQYQGKQREQELTTVIDSLQYEVEISRNWLGDVWMESVFHLHDADGEPVSREDREW